VKYRLVKIENETIPGADVKRVFSPDADGAYWYVELQDGTRIRTTHPITVIEEPAKGAQA